MMTTSMFSVTVSGLAFSSQDMTPSSRVGTTSCQTATWASGTSAVCHISIGDEPDLAVQATVAALAGTQSAAFTYDGDPLHVKSLALVSMELDPVRVIFLCSPWQC